MAVITFASTRKATGKTTAALILALELAARGRRVTVLDADPEQRFCGWQALAGTVENLTVIPQIASLSMSKAAREAKRDGRDVIIDLPVARNACLATAFGLSDHVLVPIQPERMEAEGEPVLELIHALETRASVRVAHTVLLSRVNPLLPVALCRALGKALVERGIPVLTTPLVERPLFQAMLDHGKTLRILQRDATINADRATANAAGFAAAVLKRLPESAGESLRRAA